MTWEELVANFDINKIAELLCLFYYTEELEKSLEIYVTIDNLISTKYPELEDFTNLDAPEYFRLMVEISEHHNYIFAPLLRNVYHKAKVDNLPPLIRSWLMDFNRCISQNDFDNLPSFPLNEWLLHGYRPYSEKKE